TPAPSARTDPSVHTELVRLPTPAGPMPPPSLLVMASDLVFSAVFSAAAASDKATSASLSGPAGPITCHAPAGMAVLGTDAGAPQRIRRMRWAPFRGGTALDDARPSTPAAGIAGP